MKNILLFPIFIFSSFILTAQYFSMRNVSEQQCSYDTTKLIMQLENWEVYQTENNLWDGTQLSFCHEVTKSNYKYYLNLENIDTSKAVFFRSLDAPNNTEILDPNWVYALSSDGQNKNLYDLNRACDYNLCTGVILGISIPTENDSAILTNRIQQMHFTTDFQINACIPTEYFYNQKIQEAIIKITINSIENDTLMEIPVRDLKLENYWEPVVPFDSIVVLSEFVSNNNEYNLNINDIILGDENGWFLGLHDPDLYPKPGNNTFIEANLEENISEQANINVSFGYFQTLSVQPYTELIGGLVLNSDSIRHNITFIQEEGNMCFSFAEFTYGPGTTFRYKSGDIYLGSQDACIKFKDGAKLIVDHSEMIYGDDNAAGMMALECGSEVHLEGKSSLVFNNTLAILSSLDTDYEYIDIYLKRGQSLVFNPSAKVINFGDPLIRVHMLGGKIDLGELTEEEKSKFILVYPTPKTNLNENLEIFPNPILDDFNFSYNSLEKGTFQWTITDISGQLVQKGKKDIQKGLTDYSINNIDLLTGIYFFNLKTDKGSISKKLVK